MEGSAKEKILQKIQRALTVHTPDKFPNPDWTKSVYQTSEDSLTKQFSDALEKVNGKTILCQSEENAMRELKKIIQEKNLKNILCPEKEIQTALTKGKVNFSPDDYSSADAGVTGCEVLSARTGSIFVSSAQTLGRISSVFPPVHILFASEKQLVPDLGDALIFLKKKYGDKMPSMISCITGPSRTADIEKTLVLGAHGPGEVLVLLVKE